MKRSLLITAALVCACFITAGTVSAEPPTGDRYSAGFSPVLADPHPQTKATLHKDANRLIRWQGWLDVDAFSASVLEQIQAQFVTQPGGIVEGTFTLDEPSIANAVADARKKDPDFFVVNPKLAPNAEGEVLKEGKFYVWTYRHNVADKGLYQLYVSVKGKMLIGNGRTRGIISDPVVHKDIQSLRYEFGKDGSQDGEQETLNPVIAEVEIWRGVVVYLNSRGIMTTAGNEGGVNTSMVVMSNPQAVVPATPVEPAPPRDWERAPSLEGNDNYKPQEATGAAFWHPADHKEVVPKAAGDVQQENRVKTVPTPQVRRFPR